jgi:metal-responsive CopG/Arc/MetJ family transcriptional regulator
MSNVAKVACSIDADLLARVELVRKKTGESRSAFISRALRVLTAEAARARSVARYIEAYRESPEPLEDVRAARRSARRALSRVAWEDT